MKEKLFIAFCFVATAVGGAIGGVSALTYTILKVNRKDRDRLHEIIDKYSDSLDDIID